MIIITRSNPVNPDPRVEKIIDFIKMKESVKVIGWDRSGSTSFEKKDNVPFIRCGIEAGFGNGMANLLPLIKWNIVLLKELFKTRKQYKIIHACDFDTVLPALIMKILFKKKVIYDIFDFYIDSFSVPEILKGAVKKFDYFAINNVDEVIIVSESRREQIKGSKPKQLTIINNIPNIKPLPKQRSANIISYVGILQPHRSLLEMKNVIDTLNNWELYIAGFGPLEENFHDYPNFLEKVSYEKAIEIMSSSKVLFALYSPDIPNHKYSDPNKFYEALAIGIPIIVSSNMKISKLVNEYNVGYVVEYGNKIELINVLQNIENNKKEYETKCRNAKKLHEEIFNWGIMSDRLETLYKRVGIKI